MAKELDITINVVDEGAKEKLASIDGTVDQLTQRVEAARGEVADLEAGFKQLGLSIDAPNRGLDGARQRLAAMETQLAGVTKETTAQTVAMVAQTRAYTDLDAGRMTVTKGMADQYLASQQATGGITAMTTATDAGTESMSSMDRIAERLVMRMALMMGLRMAFQFVEGIFTAATAVENLATQLDVSTDKVQEWEFASKQTGISMGLLSGAADTLGKGIAGGKDSVTVALQQLGLDTDQYFNADPGERFDQTAAAIAQMGDKTARTGVEMALFGTDKIDPLILQLQGLEDQAHSTGQVMGPETVQKLADADKAYESVWNAAKLMGAAVIVITQDVEEFVATGTHLTTWLEGLVSPLSAVVRLYQEWATARDNLTHANRDDAKTIDAQLASMTAGLSAPKNPFVSPGMGAPGVTNPLDPSKKAGLAAITALEREMTTEINAQVAAETKQLAFEKSVFAEREQLYKKIQAEMLKTSAMYLKVTNDAVVAELAAKARVNAGQGLDVHGDPIALGRTPQAIAAKAQHELDTSAATSPGVSTAARQQEINDNFLKAMMSDATAADAEAQARTKATVSATQLSVAHAGAVQAVDRTAIALATFQGVLVGTVNKMSNADMVARNAPLVVGPAGYATDFGIGQFGAGNSAGMAGPQFTAAGIAQGLGQLPHFGTGGYAPGPMPAIVGDSPGGEYMVPAQQMKRLQADGAPLSFSVTNHIHGNVDSPATADRLAAKTAELVFQKIRGHRQVQLGKAGS